jgi:hypothetical protein
MPDGNHLWRVDDHEQTHRAIRASLPAATQTPMRPTDRAMVDMGRFVRPILAMTPADPMSLSPRTLSAVRVLSNASASSRTANSTRCCS